VFSVSPRGDIRESTFTTLWLAFSMLILCICTLIVIPANAGIQIFFVYCWIPALACNARSAGMTFREVDELMGRYTKSGASVGLCDHEASLQ
jgi:hypothetical protein